MTLSFSEQVLSTLLSASVLAGIILWLLKNWITERLKNDIAHESNKELEKYKNQLSTEAKRELEELRTQVEKERSIFSAATSARFFGQKAAHERKLNAIEKTWESILNTKSKINPYIFPTDFLTPEEVSETLKNPNSSLAYKGFYQEFPKLFNSGKDVEIERIYLEDNLWALFFFHRALLSRMAFVLGEISKGSIKVVWTKDKATQQLMESITNAQELNEFDNLNIGHLSWINQMVERKFLNACKGIISGEAVSQEAFNSASEMMKVARDTEREINNQLPPKENQ